MTTPVGIIGLTYDAADLQLDDLSLFLTVTQGLNEAPTARGKDVLVPGRDGQIPRPRRPDSLPIVLSGHVMGVGDDTEESRALYRSVARVVRELFYPSRQPAALVASLEDGSTWTISARPAGSPLFNEEVPSEFAYVAVQLVSVDPDWVIEEAGS